MKIGELWENFDMLKIFFGYTDGGGKTHAMLRAARQAKKWGADVVVGYVEPDLSPETSALLEGLERLPALNLRRGDEVLEEFHIDAALARKPGLIVLGGLAHTNVQGYRHAKRYQDVEELLKAGISVYTTADVRQI